MKTVDIQNVKGVKFTGGRSYRTVLENDGLGFAMMETRIDKGGAYKWHYKNHQEACMCISGEGIIVDLTTGKKSKIYKGVTYLVDNHQPHLFTALTDVVLVSVFNPPLTGNESHDEDGNYQLNIDKTKRQKAGKIVNFVNNQSNDYDAIECVVKHL
jgi:L-ectoine synthase